MLLYVVKSDHESPILLIIETKLQQTSRLKTLLTHHFKKIKEQIFLRTIFFFHADSFIKF
jgi:hypothetical protein